MRRPCLLIACLVLAGCGARGFVSLYPEAAAVGSAQPILVASTRVRDETGAFSRARSDAVGYTRFVVSVPPEREPGAVTWPQGDPQPRTDFLTLDARRLRDAAAFGAAVDAQLATRRPGQREVTVFTHGFNSTFAEGLYRQAQMRHDFRLPGVSVHYSWPSAGAVRAYAFDRESALFARDGLEEVLEALAGTKAERIVAGAHSMGALVLMETLRQMALRGDARLFAKLQAVVLMNPDLDVDVFRRQLLALEPWDVPVYIFASAGDRALRLSSLLRGSGARVGAVVDGEAMGGLPVTIIDVSRFNDGNDALGHLAVATSPTMIAMIAGMQTLGQDIIEDERDTPGILEGVANAVGGLGTAVTGRGAP